MKTTIGELKNFHRGCGKVHLMFQDEAGFGRINHPKYCWCEKASDPAFHVTIFGNTGMPMVRSSR